MIYAVMESVGNFAHTIKEFNNEDEARELIMNRAIETTKEAFTGNYEDYADNIDFADELELQLSYYSVDRWSE